MLRRDEDALGADLPVYRNHVYRGLTYHQALRGAPVPDWAALAWAVHDLGIRTARTFDYLEPSAGLASTLAVADPMIETFRVTDRIEVSRGLLSGPCRGPSSRRWWPNCHTWDSTRSWHAASSATRPLTPAGRFRCCAGEAKSAQVSGSYAVWCLMW